MASPPFRSDFIDYVKCEIPVRDDTEVNTVARQHSHGWFQLNLPFLHVCVTSGNSLWIKSYMVLCTVPERYGVYVEPCISPVQSDWNRELYTFTYVKCN